MITTETDINFAAWIGEDAILAWSLRAMLLGLGEEIVE